MLIDSLQVTFAKSVDCQSNNVFHYFILQTFPTEDTFSINAILRQCLSYHKSKFFLVQMVV